MNVWNSLPAEILEIIFEGAPNATDLYQLALVCKAWAQPAQTILYLDVHIHTLSQLKEFRDAVMCNPQLGIAVKILRIDDSISHGYPTMVKADVLAIVFAHIPNLERLEDFSLRPYIPVAKALQNSQLTRLKSLTEPDTVFESEQVTNYISSALLMKNRLKNLKISDNYHFTDKELLFNRLYSEIHFFKNLTTLTIERKTNEEIEVLEHIAESCKHLKEITFNFQPSYFDAPLNANIAIDTISNFTPRPNIKVLNNESRGSFDEKTLIYLMQKFPSLHSFNFCVDRYDTFSHSLNQHRVIQLLQYLSNVEEFKVDGFRADEDTIADSFTSFCEKTCKHNLQIYYTDGDHAGTFDISRSKQTVAILIFFSLNSDWKHLEFLEKNGMFTRSVQFTMDSPTTTPDNFMTHMVRNCPNLKNLWITDCIFPYSTIEEKNFNTKLSLDELKLQRNVIDAVVLKQWSHMLFEVKNLDLGNRPTPSEIVMPQTVIGSITMELSARRVFVKLFVSSSNSLYYYLFDQYKFEVETSNEESYLNAKDSRGRAYYVCCQTKPTFKMW